jgi:hypothetical protein
MCAASPANCDEGIVLILCVLLTLYKGIRIKP